MNAAKIVLLCGLYAAVLFFYALIHGYSYWYVQSHGMTVTYFIYGVVAVVFACQFSRHLNVVSWWLLPTMYVVPIWVFGWPGRSNGITLSYAIVLAVLLSGLQLWRNRRRQSASDKD